MLLTYVYMTRQNIIGPFLVVINLHLQPVTRMHNIFFIDANVRQM